MLDDTSFAISPEKEKEQRQNFIDIGNVVDATLDGYILKVYSEIAEVNILFYREDIVRVIMNPAQSPSLTSSPALTREPEPLEASFQEEEDLLTFSSKKMTVQILKTPFRISIYDHHNSLLVQENKKGMAYSTNGEVICYKEMSDADHFYGFGEKTGYLNKRGEKLTMWNSDVYAPHNPETDPLYESIPYFMTMRNGRAHGIFFDNTFKTTFDMRSSSQTYSMRAEGGQLDYYVLAGPHPKDVLEQYTYLTGRMPIPPKWALGYHQSRYSYQNEQEVRTLAQTFIKKKIPVDVIYLDIHYMDGYRVFTFDKARFPTPKKLIDDLKNQGIRIVPIVDPGVKKDADYPIYKQGVLHQYFCKYLEGNIYYGEVWPGMSAFPDFVRQDVQQWWGQSHSFYTELGIDGIWNDMNEPAVFNETKTMDLDVIHNDKGTLKTHREVHNLYGLLMGKATYEGLQQLLNGKRPFLLTRAGYAGVQRYAAVWTGDNRSFWEHLQMSLPMCMNLGLSGVAFSGADVGGFAHHSNGQLLTRWTQVGAFLPYFRNHCAIDFVQQEPWAFGERYESIIKKYIELRYIWLPHFYSLFAFCHRTGTPVMRPLFMEYPADPHVTNLSDQFMIGDNVLIAPIMNPDTTYRAVYLPDGAWSNYWTDQQYEGGQHILFQAELETMPIFIRENSFVVHGAVRQSTMQPDRERIIHLYPSSGTAVYTLYEDDGETLAYEQGHYFEARIEAVTCNDRISLTITKLHSGYKPAWEKCVLCIHHASEKITVTINEKSQKASYNHEESTLNLSLQF